MFPILPSSHRLHVRDDIRLELVLLSFYLLFFHLSDLSFITLVFALPLASYCLSYIALAVIANFLANSEMLPPSITRPLSVQSSSPLLVVSATLACVGQKIIRGRKPKGKRK